MTVVSRSRHVTVDVKRERNSVKKSEFARENRPRLGMRVFVVVKRRDAKTLIPVIQKNATVRIDIDSFVNVLRQSLYIY